MRLSDELGIRWNDADTLEVPNLLGWSMAPVPSDDSYLTQYFDGFITHSQGEGESISCEFFLPGCSDEVLSKEVEIAGRSLEAIRQTIKEEAYVYNAIIASPKRSLLLLITHDEVAILIGNRSAIESVTRKSISQLHEEFTGYIQEWSGVPATNASRLLDGAKTYPSSVGPLHIAFTR